MNYEIQIFAKDRTKVVKIEDHETDQLNTLLAWEDFYYAMGNVIDGKADKFKENNTQVARINVQDMTFDQVVDIMCEDLGSKLIKILTEEKETSILEMV